MLASFKSDYCLSCNAFTAHVDGECYVCAEVHPARVVRCGGRRDNIPGYVYVGRPSKWGNPFVMPDHGTREEVIKKYEEWITVGEGSKILQPQLWQLKNCLLGCWCQPLPCHGDVLAKLVNAL